MDLEDVLNVSDCGTTSMVADFDTCVPFLLTQVISTVVFFVRGAVVSLPLVVVLLVSGETQNNAPLDEYCSVARSPCTTFRFSGVRLIVIGCCFCDGFDLDVVVIARASPHKAKVSVLMEIAILET